MQDYPISSDLRRVVQSYFGITELGNLLDQRVFVSKKDEFAVATTIRSVSLPGPVSQIEDIGEKCELILRVSPFVTIASYKKHERVEGSVTRVKLHMARYEFSFLRLSLPEDVWTAEGLLYPLSNLSRAHTMWEAKQGAYPDMEFLEERIGATIPPFNASVVQVGLC